MNQQHRHPSDEQIPVPEVVDSDFGAFIEAVATAQPAHWTGAPLTPMQAQRHQAQVDAMRAGRLARWPDHLPWGML